MVMSDSPAFGASGAAGTAGLAGEAFASPFGGSDLGGWATIAPPVSSPAHAIAAHVFARMVRSPDDLKSAFAAAHSNAVRIGEEQFSFEKWSAAPRRSWKREDRRGAADHIKTPSKIRHSSPNTKAQVVAK